MTLRVGTPLPGCPDRRAQRWGTPGDGCPYMLISQGTPKKTRHCEARRAAPQGGFSWPFGPIHLLAIRIPSGAKHRPVLLGPEREKGPGCCFFLHPGPCSFSISADHFAHQASFHLVPLVPPFWKRKCWPRASHCLIRGFSSLPPMIQRAPPFSR